MSHASDCAASLVGTRRPSWLFSALAPKFFAQIARTYHGTPPAAPSCNEITFLFTSPRIWLPRARCCLGGHLRIPLGDRLLKDGEGGPRKYGRVVTAGLSYVDNARFFKDDSTLSPYMGVVRDINANSGGRRLTIGGLAGGDSPVNSGTVLLKRISAIRFEDR